MFKEEKIFYKSKDGLKLCGIFLTPKEIKGYVLLAHGINVNKNEWGNFYADIAEELCKKDFATLRFDFRGHGESNGAQRDMTIIGETLDITASVEQILKRWSGKIAIIGMSFGAGPAILYSSRKTSEVRGLVLLCPVLDYVYTFLNPIVPWAKDIFNKKGFKHLSEKGFLLLDDEFELGAKLIEEFKVIKPYEFLKKIKIPVLAIHGDKDSMVPYKVSKKYGKPNKVSLFITIKNAEHGFIDSNDESGESIKSLKNKRTVIEKVVEWIVKWGKT